MFHIHELKFIQLLRYRNAHSRGKSSGRDGRRHFPRMVRVVRLHEQYEAATTAMNNESSERAAVARTREQTLRLVLAQIFLRCRTACRIRRLFTNLPRARRRCCELDGRNRPCLSDFTLIWEGSAIAVNLGESP